MTLCTTVMGLAEYISYVEQENSGNMASNETLAAGTEWERIREQAVDSSSGVLRSVLLRVRDWDSLHCGVE